MVTILNSKFQDNKASLLHAGAITIIQFAVFNIINSEFIGNIAPGDCGCLLIYGGYMVNIQDSLFESNIATTRAGVMIGTVVQGNIIINNTKFIGNKAITDECGGMFFASCSSVELTNLYIENNSSGTAAGAISLKEINNISIQFSIFKQCTAIQGYGGALRINNSSNLEFITSIFISELEFIENQAKFGGALQLQTIIHCQNCILQNLKFLGNLSNSQGGSIQIDNILSIEFQNLEFQNSYAKDNAGSISILQSQDIIFTLIKIVKSSTQGNGAGIQVTDNSKNIYFNQFIYQDSNAQEQGGVQIKLSNNIQFVNLQLFNNYAGKSSAGLLITDCQDILIQDFKIYKNKSYQNSGFSVENSENIQMVDGEILENESENNVSGGQFLLCKNVNIENMLIKNNISQQNTGGIYLIQCQNSQLINSILQSNFALNMGGALTIESSQSLLLQNLQISNNIAEKFGGGIVLKSSDQVEIINTDIYNNESIYKGGGGIYVDGTFNFLFQESKIFNNKAVDGAAIQLSQLSGFLFQNIQFYQNYAQNDGAAIDIQDNIDGEIQFCQIYDNTSISKGGAIIIDKSNNISIDHSSIYNNKCTLGQGGGIYVQNESQKIQINNSQIYQNYALEEGGGIFLFNNGDLTIKNSQIYQNFGIKQGAGIFARFFTKISIIDTQIYNHGVIFGEIDANSQQIFINGINKYEEDFKCDYGSAIYINQVQNIIFNNSKIYNNESQNQGGAVFINNSTQLHVENTTFSNNKIILQDQVITQLYGGTIYGINIDTFFFQNSSILNSQSPYIGGGIYINGNLLFQVENSQFIDNQLILDKNIPLFEKGQQYEVTFGGAIYIEPNRVQNININNQKSSQIIIKNNKFQNCWASSGGAILINQNPSSTIDLDIQNNNFKNNIADLGPSLRFLGEFSNNIDKQQLNNYNNNIDESNISLILPNINYFFGYYLNERKINTLYSIFALCFQGSFLKEGGELICEQCLDNSECLGGYVPIYPSSGYWRTDENSYDMIHCSNNPKFCLGNDTCLTGYTGLLCEQCDFINNYAPSGAGECSKCQENKYFIYQKLVLIFIGVVLLLLNQIYGVNMRIKKRQIQKILNIIFDYSVSRISQLSGITKIFIMHCQVTYLVASYNIDIPIEVTQSFNIMGNPQEMFSNSINCLIDVKDKDEIKSLGYYLSIYSLIATILTVIFIMVLEIIIFFFKRFIHQKSHLIQYMQCSILCFFITLQPGLLQKYLQFVTCRKIAGKYYSLADTNISCDEEFFYNKILPTNISMIVILGLIIPAFLGYRLYRGFQNQRLKRIQFQRIFGILYMEYTPQHFYWEIYSILTKMTIVVLSILFDQDIILKSVYVLFVLIMYGFMCLNKWPFVTKQLNQLSLTSTIIQIITIGLVICIETIQENEKQALQISIIIIILGTNLIFILVSGFLMVLDFKMTFRYAVTSFMKIGCLSIRKWVDKIIGNEKKAKIRWRKIKLSIHEIILRKRDGEVENFEKELLVHMKKIFQIKEDFLPSRTSINKSISRNLSLTSQQFYNLEQKRQSLKKQNTKKPQVKVISPNIYDFSSIQEKQNESGLTFNNSINETSRQQLNLKQNFQVQSVDEIDSQNKFYDSIDIQSNTPYQQTNLSTRKYSQEPQKYYNVSIPSIRPHKKSQFSNNEAAVNYELSTNKSIPQQILQNLPQNTRKQSNSSGFQNIFQRNNSINSARLFTQDNQSTDPANQKNYNSSNNNNNQSISINQQHQGDDNSSIVFSQTEIKIDDIFNQKEQSIQKQIQSNSNLLQQSIQTNENTMLQSLNSLKSLKKKKKKQFRNSSIYKKKHN